MLGLALEGGGAKGAFHMGAVKAFLEAGYEFGGIAGTSIGAFNGAIITQGDFESGYKLWENMDTSLIFNIEEEQVRKVMNKKIDKETFLYLSSKLKGVFENRGLDTSKIKKMLDSIIDEDKILKSKIDFGIVTVSVTDLKPLEIYKEDIPLGRMTDYLMASANFPAFKIEPIEGKYYLDGGFYDNCPINLLVRKGYKEIIAVRTLSIGILKKTEGENIKVTNIIPSDKLGMILNFDNNHIKRNLKMGYHDAMRVIKHLKGRKYYIENIDNNIFFSSLLSIPEDVIYKIGKIMLLPQMEPKRMLFEKIFPTLANMLNLPVDSTYQDIFIGILEHIADENYVEEYRIRNFSGFLEEIKSISSGERNTTIQPTPSIAKRSKLSSIFSREPILKEVAQEFINVLLPEQFI